MYNVTILKYNNYFNRIVKREESVLNYLDFDSQSFAGINFNPNDGINTKLVLNTDFDCDYVVVSNPEDLSIESRWFITESKYERNGQRTLSLRRDLVADFYQQITEAPCYIEKATLSPNDPMIFNSEGMQFNRILRSQKYLVDETEMGWIIGYTQPTSIETTSFNFTGETNYISVASLSTWDFFEYSTTNSSSTSVSKYWRANYRIFAGAAVYSSYDIKNVDENGNSFTETNGSFAPFGQGFQVKGKSTNNIQTYLKSDLHKHLIATYLGTNTQGDADFLELDGKTIKDLTTGKFYLIHVKAKTKEKKEWRGVDSTAGNLYNGLLNAMTSDYGEPLSVVNYNTLMMLYSFYTESFLYLEETQVISGDIVIEANDKLKKKAEDADYTIFAIPCPKKGSAIRISAEWAEGAGSNVYTYEKSMAIAQTLAYALQPASSGGHLIDLQFLPYCPIKQSSDIADRIKVRQASGSAAFWAEIFILKKSSFSVDIDYSIQIENPKESNECDQYRLVSPNYSSSFEFSPAKNGGVMFFHAQCTYKPFTPYINIHPYFQNLYGDDFDDNRGLVLAGDFSLPMTSDAFITYQIQNKNYSNIFDRQMSHMDKQNAWNMAGSVAGAITGTIQGAAMGSLAGPAGAVAGGIASGIGGALDITQQALMMAENKNFQKDMYSYQLGNIDSKPNSLVKSSAFDISFKVWPYVEYSSCSDEEREAFRQKIKYNGMTVNRIGRIIDFIPDSTFIKGQLIRIEISEDSHLLNEIYNEIAKGVYFL